MPKIAVNGLSFHYEQLGEEGEPLVFLSGLGGDHRAFSLAQRYFSNRYRTFAFDSRDAGQSDRATAPYTIADMADDVAGWMKAIGLADAHIVGQSLGGLVAQSLAIHHPERVKSLSLVSSHVGGNPWRRAVLESWVLMRRQVPIGPFTKATLPWLVAPSFYAQESQIEGLIRFAERNPWPQDAEAFARQANAAAAHDGGSLIQRIRVPCLVLVGQLDLVNPPRIAAELAEGLSDARLVVLPNVGHMPHIEDKQGFRDAVDRFLQHVRGD